MPPPHDAPSLPTAVSLNGIMGGLFTLSQPLIDLLVSSRNNYDWPNGTGASRSQQAVKTLVATVNTLMLPVLIPNNAHSIIIAVSQWAGNNVNSHNAICHANAAQKHQMQAAITNLVTPGHEILGIDQLCALPGLNLVIASKIFRFCSPQYAAAVDRHASYFFNSLQIVGQGNTTGFSREWSNANHNTSRLAIYTQSGYTHNKTHYFSYYLPTLYSISSALNLMHCQYTCASSRVDCYWTPADVEMAAYYWWAQHGAR